MVNYPPWLPMLNVPRWIILCGLDSAIVAERKALVVILAIPVPPTSPPTCSSVSRWTNYNCSHPRASTVSRPVFPTANRPKLHFPRQLRRDSRLIAPINLGEETFALTRFSSPLTIARNYILVSKAAVHVAALEINVDYRISRLLRPLH